MSRNDPWRPCRQSELTGGHYFRRKRARLMEDKQPSHPEQASRAAPLCLRAKYEKNGSIVSDTEDSVRSDNGRNFASTRLDARRPSSQKEIATRYRLPPAYQPLPSLWIFQEIQACLREQKTVESVYTAQDIFCKRWLQRSSNEFVKSREQQRRYNKNLLSAGTWLLDKLEAR